MEHRQDEYLERLLLSLRIRQVPFERIRDILDEVGSHLDASGEDPVETFGPTSELADALVEARPVTREHRVRPLPMAAIALGSFVTPLLLLSGGAATITGEPVTVTVGILAGITVALAAIGAGLPLSFAWLDGRRGRWATVAVWTAGLVAFVVLAGILTTPVIAEVPGWSALVAGAVCVVVVVTLVRAETRRARARGLGPITAADRSRLPAPSGTARALRRAEARLPAWMLESHRARLVFIATVILVGLLGGLAVAVYVDDPSPAVILAVGVILGGFIGDAIGAARVRREHDGATSCDE